MVYTSNVCPNCAWRDRRDATAYRPEAGLDPNLREFECIMCGQVWFQQMSNDYIDRERASQAEARKT